MPDIPSLQDLKEALGPKWGQRVWLGLIAIAVLVLCTGAIAEPRAKGQTSASTAENCSGGPTLDGDEAFDNKGDGFHFPPDRRHAFTIRYQAATEEMALNSLA